MGGGGVGEGLEGLVPASLVLCQEQDRRAVSVRCHLFPRLFSPQTESRRGWRAWGTSGHSGDCIERVHVWQGRMRWRSHVDICIVFFICFFFKDLFIYIYLFSAVLGPSCSTRPSPLGAHRAALELRCAGFSLQSSWTAICSSPCHMWGTAAQGHTACRRRAGLEGSSRCGAWAPWLWPTSLVASRQVGLPGPGVKPVSPALAGRFGATRGAPHKCVVLWWFSLCKFSS